MYDVMKQAEEKLVQVGYDLTISVIVFVLSVIILTIIFNIVLTIWNNKKPPEERKSPLIIFLIAVVVGWAITTLVFVYRMVMIGLEYLKS
jgi:heme/copper-type cytochrome/quinol oxidase subunit 2